MRVLICGGRHYANWLKVYTVLDDLLKQHGRLTVIQGGATGADALAREWVGSRSWRRGKRCGPPIDLKEEKAEWRKHGRAAGPIRNQAMLDRHSPELVVAFRGGSGTADMMRKARAAGVEVREIEP